MSAATDGGVGGGSGGAGSGGRGSSNGLLGIVQAQTNFLISTLSEENVERNWTEIKSHIDQHGIDIQLYFVRRLITLCAAHLRTSSPAPTGPPPSSSVLPFRLLQLEANRLSSDPFLAVRLRDAVDKAPADIAGADNFRQFDLARFVDRVGLGRVERIVLEAAFLGAQRRDLVVQAARLLREGDVESAADGIVLGESPEWLGSPSTPQLPTLLTALYSDPPDGSPPIPTPLERHHKHAVLLALSHRLPPQALAALLASVIPNLAFAPTKHLRDLLVDLAATPELAAHPDVIRAALVKFGWPSVNEPAHGIELRSAELFSSLGELGPASATVDVAALCRVIASYSPTPSFAALIRAFDSATTPPPPPSILVSLLLSAPAPPPSATQAQPAVSGLLGTWVNTTLQINALASLLALAPEQFSFAALPGGRVVTVEQIATASPTIKAMAASVQGSTWNNLEVLETVVRLEEHGGEEVDAVARELLENAGRTNGELVLMGLIQIQKPWSPFHLDLTSRLLALFLAGSPSHQLVFLRLWQVDRSFVTAAFRKFYEDSNMNVTRILDVAQDLKILDQVLDVRPVAFALDMAALASRREYLNLDKWLQDRINAHGTAFVRDALEFLDGKAKSEATRLETGQEQTTMPLNVQTVAIFLRALRANAELLPLVQEDIDYYKEIRNLCLQYWPRLMNLMPHTDQEPGLSVMSFSPEMDREVEDYYHRMYSGDIRVEDVIVFLQRAKASSNPRDHELFAAMIHTLFEEYRHYETYPPAELAMTGVLFGSLIQYHIIDFIPLGIAIRYVLTALRSVPESNRFRFGVQALSQFQRRLPEWPQVCQALLAIPHLVETLPDLAEYARLALEHSADASAQAQAQAQALATAAEIAARPRRAFTAVNVDPLPEGESEEYDVPDEETSDRILFIINNLAPSNIEAKTEEMRERFRLEHARWFAHYLVLERVAMEPNNHGLYMQFLDVIGQKGLLRHVLRETFAKIDQLLNDDKTVSSSGERAHLKNLGSWLGGLTLARDKPIKFRNIAFKELLVQGYDANRLIVAIPFVCKVLEQCSHSRVFHPPNPWLMAVLRLLVELYQFAELKLNLKFEIEVLCKSLGIDLKDIEPTSILKNRSPQDAAALAAAAAGITGQQQTAILAQDLERLQLAGISADRIHAAAAAQQPLQQFQQGLVGGPAAAAVAAAAAASPSLAGGVAAAQADQLISGLPNLAQYITFNPAIPLFATNPQLKRIIHIAIERAIREIIAPVVERSVTIAALSTRELVAKDFAMEGDERKMQGAAHLMVQNLAGNLALVTCKEPLRISMVTHARNLLMQNGFTEQTVPEQAVFTIVQDNLDLACSIIEKAAMEKAIPEVDEGLAVGYVNRRKHRERSNQAYWDNAAVSAAHFSASLPDLLRIKPNGLEAQQLHVYEDFGRLPRAQSAGSDGKRSVSRAGMPQAAYPASPATPDLAFDGAMAGPGLLTTQQAFEKFTQLLVELDKALAAVGAPNVAALPPTNEIRQIVQQIPVVAAQSVTREETALGFAQKVVQLLYKSDSQLAREVFVVLLERLCEVSAKAAKEVMEWLILADDDRKFNVPVTVALVRAGLINAAQLDVSLSRVIVRELRLSTIDFTAKLIRECLFAEPVTATRAHFINSLEALAFAAQRSKTTESMTLLHEGLKSNAPAAQPPRIATPSASDLADGNATLRQQLALRFAEWVKIFGMSPSPEKVFVPFIQQLSNQGVLKGEETSTLFFRICVELGVDSYIKQKAEGANPAFVFQPIDALAKLVVLLIKYHADPTGANHDQAKVTYLNKIISIASLVLAQSHEELGPHFQQKPFFRLFSSLLVDLHGLESSLQTAYPAILLTISNSLANLQPNYFPGFVFSWMSLISHRLFMPKILAPENRDGWVAFHRLLIALFRFLAPFLRTVELQNTSRTLYKGTLRILLVLLHDFPEFLSDYAASFCDIIPSSCVQLRNLILSAFPRKAVTLPDPFSPSLQLELLPQIHQVPTVLLDYTLALQASDFRAALDLYLQQRGPVPPFKDLLVLPGVGEPDYAKGETRHNVPAINALVLYVGAYTVAQQKAQTGQVAFVSTAPAVGIIEQLLADLDPEGRYLVVSAIANQLRFPSAHTFWYNRLILHIFGETKDEKIADVITRVLLERLLVTRPHPWGILRTFRDVLKHDDWAKYGPAFASLAPELSSLFASVMSSFSS